MEKKPQLSNKGMFTDANQEFQPEGTYTFLLNGILDGYEGDKGSVTNEMGNEFCFQLPEQYENDNFKIIGACLLPDNRVVLFLTNDIRSMIGIQNPNCTFEILILSDLSYECLNFKTTHMIDCMFKLHNGCDYYIYFTDSLNKYKVININNIDQYKIPTVNGYDCGLMNLSPDYSIPDIYFTNILNTGSLRIGAYQFTIRYLDEYLNPTNWTNITNPVYITLPIENNINHDLNNGGYLGVPAGDGFYYSSKAIQLGLQNLDPYYKYYQIGIIESSGELGEVTNAYTSEYFTIPITRKSTYVLNGNFPTDGLVSVDLSEITIPTVTINVAKAHAQLENRLLLGNLEDPVRDWAAFQRAANEIQTEYFVYDGDSFTVNNCEQRYDIQTDPTNNPNPDEYKDYSFPLVSYDNKTYMRDEVYALGIVFMFKDGSESPVFHIPGRPKIGNVSDPNDKNDYAVTTYTVDGTPYTSAVGYNYWTTLYSGVNNQNGDMYNVWSPEDGPYTGVDWDTYLYSLGGAPFWDRTLIDGSQSPTTVDQSVDSIATCEVLQSYNDCNKDNIERWRHVNTSIVGEYNPELNPSDLCKHKYNVRETGLMGYYDTGTLYPDTKDCNGVPIYPHNTRVVGGETIYDMHYIRHHMMPDARKVNHFESTPIAEEFNTIQGCESVFTLLPIGIKYSNVNTAIVNNIPQDIQDQIQSFYFVRGDRAGNKTVIDKGWMNVTDVTWGYLHEYIDDTAVIIASGQLYQDYKKLQVNRWYLTPDQKVGMFPPSTNRYTKEPRVDGWNIVEFFSPKSSFNDIVNLGGDYYKVENTLYGGFSVYDGLEDIAYIDATSESRWKLCTYGLFDKAVIPHMYNFDNRNNAYAVYKLPIQSSEYALYNQITNSSLVPDFQIKNDLYRQTMMISKLFYNSSTDNSCGCQKPKQTAYYTGDVISSGVEDIIPWKDNLNQPTGGYGTQFINFITPFDWISNGVNPSFGEIGRQFEGFNDDSFAQCRRVYSPFAYYAALKNDIRPYQKLESIKYIKTTNYVIEADGYRLGDTCFQNNERMFIGGGDCFITRQQQVKTFFWQRTTTPASQNHNFGGSMLWGYVESEINAHYRHKQQGDDYYAYPWDSIHETIYEITQQLRPNPSRTTAQQFYHYRLDYSKDNNDRTYFPLSDSYQFCSDCSNKYPYTIAYSDVSSPESRPDKYRIFRTASNKVIPGDTGEITNLIIKEQNLFAFTVSNLWRFNISPQQLRTDIDVVQIAQGGFLNIVPIKVFDNKQGSPRGGCEFKFSSAYGDDSFIWVDNLSGRIYEMTNGIKEISLAGMKRYFKNNIDLKLREQYKLVTKSPFFPNGFNYKIFSTTSGIGIGYNATYDPQFNRYILHKRDFTIVPEALDENGLLRVVQLFTPPVGSGLLYYNPFTEKFYISDLNIPYYTEIESFEEYPQFFKNESFTMSYSIQDKVWVSFHSYLPSFMYYDFDTFYSTYGNNINLVDISWKHNVHNYTSYCEEKFNFIIDFIQTSKSPYQENVFDTVEYTSNTFEWDPISENYKEIQFKTFTQMYVYNNNQISNLKDLIVSNLNPYQHIQFNINTAYVNKDRNYWRIKKFRDMSVNRLTTPESLFSRDWTNVDFTNYFSISGLGYIDKIINPNIIDLNKNIYKQQRFTDKYLGVRLFFDPRDENGNPLNYKINLNIRTDLTRDKI